MKDSFIFYRSFWDALETVHEGNRLEILNAIIQFALDQKEPELRGVSQTVFILIRPQLVANHKKGNGGKFGILGGRPKKKKPIGLIIEKPIGLSENNPNVNVNDNKNGNGNKKNPLLSKKHLFIKSIFYEKKAFAEALPDWTKEKLKYYYEALDRWSAEGNKKIDWIATAKNWASRDEKEGKIKFSSTPERKDFWGLGDLRGYSEFELREQMNIKEEDMGWYMIIKSKMLTLENQGKLTRYDWKK